ncbi:MAG: MerR family transcriptional regulator, partial [Rhodospirillales bacterium]
PQHVLRFWESKFNQIRPLKRGGGRRYYRPEDVTHLKQIRKLLYDEGYTIKGVQKLLQKNGTKTVALETKSDADKKPLTVVAETPAPVSPALDPAMRQSLEAALKELEDLRALLKAHKS